MSLPVVKYPSFMLTIPSTQETVKFRPFTVAEEKILLMANASEDVKSVTDSIAEVLSACFFGKVDVANLPSFDIEFLFLNVRAKSVSEKIEMQFRNQSCPEEDGNPCQKSVKISIDIADVKVQKQNAEGTYEVFVPGKVTPNGTMVKISDEIAVAMVYPNMAKFADVNDIENPIDQIEALVVSCITAVYDEENVYTDFSKKEMIDWYNALLSNQKEPLIDFVKNMPSLRYQMDYTCKVCGYEETMVFEGLQSFL